MPTYHETVEVVDPFFFGEESFVEANMEAILEYIEYRVHGYHEALALRRVFGENYNDSKLYARIDKLEHNRAYRDIFEKRLKEIPLEELWNDRLSIHELLSIMRSWATKDATRLAAARELNVLCGITVVDENGRTRAGRNWNDFYKSQAAQDFTRHPEPGSPEANRFMDEARKLSERDQGRS